jgi:putative DNA primase/helicase
MHWVSDQWLDVQARMLDTVRHQQDQALKIGDEDERKRVRKHAFDSESDPSIRRALNLARSVVPVVESDFDNDTDLFNVRNGTLFVPSCEIADHRREDLITKLAGVEFIEGAEAPTFHEFLKRIVPDDALRALLQVLFGCALSGRSMIQYLPMLIGEGANGRSTLLKILLKVFGDYGHQAPASLFMESKQSRGAAMPELMALRGRRLVTAIETGQGNHLDETIVKSITGGDQITARDLYQKGLTTFDPTHLAFLITNHPPVIKGTDHAIRRRLLKITFTERIPPSEQEDQDELVARIVSNEGSGILNWLLDGYQQYLKHGLAIPESVSLDTQEYIADSDVLAQFLEERCTVTPGAAVKNADIWGQWEAWCKANGIECGSQMVFSQNLSRRRGIEKGKSNGFRCWKGVGLR